MARGLPTTTSPGTRANYATVLGTHVQPALGEARADELTVEHVEALLDAMAEHGYAASTIRLTLSLLKRVLTFGQRRGIVVRNVADLAQPPPPPPSQGTRSPSTRPGVCCRRAPVSGTGPSSRCRCCSDCARARPAD